MRYLALLALLACTSGDRDPPAWCCMHGGELCEAKTTKPSTPCPIEMVSTGRAWGFATLISAERGLHWYAFPTPGNCDKIRLPLAWLAILESPLRPNPVSTCMPVTHVDGAVFPLRR